MMRLQKESERITLIKYGRRLGGRPQNLNNKETYMEIFTLTLGVCATNCYITKIGNTALVVDPADEGETICAFLREKNLEPVACVITHAHFDHIYGLDTLCETFPKMKVYAHKLDADALSDTFRNLSSPLFGVPYAYKGDVEMLCDGQILPVGDVSFEVLHTPGHTEGSICLYNKDEGVLFSGDTLFYETCGRVDFPGGDAHKMKASLKRLCSLSGDCEVYPGHECTTTLSHERQYNLMCHD